MAGATPGAQKPHMNNAYPLALIPPYPPVISPSMQHAFYEVMSERVGPNIVMIV